MRPNHLLEASYLARYFLLNSVDILDYKIFPSREIQNTPPAFHFLPTKHSAALQPLLSQALSAVLEPASAGAIDSFMGHNGTTAFLIIKNDQLLYERYYNGCDRSSICTSFSIAKSFVSALVGIALHEKLIGQLDDPITRYIPDLSGSYWKDITIRHLVSMSSGLEYKRDGFFPWSDQPRIYYTLDLRQLARQAKYKEPPGLHFHYNNYNLILLGMILECVTGGKVSTYLQEKLWKPLGMEFPASWSLDSQQSGMEKMESGLNARAIDFAKFGRLYLHKGDWEGKQLVPEAWVTESTTAAPDAKWMNYKYLWWIPHPGTGRFMAIGSLAQFIYVASDKDCIILRFGRGKPRNWKQIYPQLFACITELL